MPKVWDALGREMSEDYVIKTIGNLKQRYHIDHVFLMGFSQGASFTYATGIKYHKQFSGILPFAGYLDTEWL
ncbi:hypothetical protein ACFLU6_14300, partial [Acidobacteriota bacterium]